MAVVGAQLIYAAWSASILVFGVGTSYWVATRRNHFEGWQTFIALGLFAGSAWQCLFLANVLTTNRQLQALTVYGELGMGIGTAILWAVFVSIYTKRNFHHQRWFVTISAVTVVGYVLAALSNPAHGLLLDVVFYQEPFSFGSADRGPLYFLLLLVPHGMLGVGVVLLFSYISSTRYLSRLRMSLLMSSAVTLGVLNVLTILDLTPIPELEHASLGGLPFLVFAVVGLFKLGLLDVEPVARNTLVEALTDPVLVIDEHWRVSDYNHRFQELCSGVETSVGDRFETACPWIAGKLDIDELPDAADQRSEKLVLTVDSERRYYSVRVTPITRPGGRSTAGYAILFRNVTELEHSRRALERQNENLERFASMVSHDLRNPLSVANGHATLARCDADDEQVRDHLDTVVDAHNRMDDIVEDILALAREGQHVEETEPLTLQSVAREAWGYVNDTQDATLTVASDATIRANKSRLLTGLENLFRNAIDHGEPTVEVEVGVERTRVVSDGSDAGPVDEPGLTRVYVADDGAGIPADEQDDIFEFGYTNSDDGTGLGLAIVETIAEAHDWSVSLDDEYDDGARFVFTEVSLAEDSPDD